MQKDNLKIAALFLLLLASFSSYSRDKTLVPDWVSKGVIYQIWLRSFTIEGTLKAASQKLPEVADLGATIVYLSPVMLQDTSMNKDFWSPRQQASPANNPRNPYRIMDYTKVDPEYGTEEDLKEFIETAHKLNLRVLMDLVYLHTGPSNVLTKEHRNYKLDEDGNFRKNQWNFYNLNYENKSLREFLLKNMEDWVRKYNFDGWRCDVSGGVPLDFWEEARARLEKIRPDIGMLAESNKPEELFSTFDMSYSFPWYNALGDVFSEGYSATLLKVTWQKLNKDFPQGTLFVRYSDNHDLNRPNLVFGEKGSKAVSVLNIMLDGIPLIFNGQEFGDASPYGIRYYPEKSYADNGAIRWNIINIPQNAELYNWYKALIELRKSNTVFQEGNTVWLKTDNPESAIAFLRQKGNEEILVVINVSNRNLDIEVEIPDKNVKTYDGIISSADGKVLEAIENKIAITLESFGYFVGKLKQK